MMKSMNDSRQGKLPAALLAAMLLGGAAAGCAGVKDHIVDAGGQPLPYYDFLWLEVDRAFPDTLPDRVCVKLIEGGFSRFDITRNEVFVSNRFSEQVRRGKICLGLTHLALHRLSGGTERMYGRCFDNDVRFLEHSLASYMDRRVGGQLDGELEESYRIAARLFSEKKLEPGFLRDWRSFCYRGNLADQQQDWNLEGMRALLTLGRFLLETWRFSELGEIFSGLDGDATLEEAVKQALGMELGVILEDWKRDVLKRAAGAGQPTGTPDVGEPGK